MPSVMILTKLREGVDQDEYEQWVKEYDYPMCKRHFSSVKFYRAYKAVGDSKGKAPYDFVEHLDLSSFEDYQRDVETPEFKELIRQWGEFLRSEEAILINTEPIE